MEFNVTKLHSLQVNCLEQCTRLAFSNRCVRDPKKKKSARAQICD